MSHEEWCDRVAQRLGELWGDQPAAQELVDAWSAEPGEIGVAKPHPAAYGHALAVVGEVRGEALRAVDVLVVDDSVTNVAAAAALGHPTHHFRDLGGLRAATGAARAESVREAPHTRARGAARTE
jgi:beta-phosphoglucomutase-like phosphatase (HAD superfamily)